MGAYYMSLYTYWSAHDHFRVGKPFSHPPFPVNDPRPSHVTRSLTGGEERGNEFQHPPSFFFFFFFFEINISNVVLRTPPAAT